MNRAGIHVDDTVFEALACADSVLRTDERELGVCLADIGAGSTDLIVYYEGVVIHTGVIPVGGDHFTNDVAVGFRTPLPEAENIKKMFGCAIVTRIPEGNEIEVPSVGDRPSRLHAAAHARRNSRAACARAYGDAARHLRQAGVVELCGAGLVLTGGGSRLPGLLEVAEDILRRPVRLGLSAADREDAVGLAGTGICHCDWTWCMYGHRARRQARMNHGSQDLAPKA